MVPKFIGAAHDKGANLDTASSIVMHTASLVES